MPPRRSARLTAAAEAACTALAPLPLAIVLHIFALLALDVRLRAQEVCRGWRATLAERSLWTTLDLSPESGVVRRHATAALLCAASARAGGGVRVLNVISCKITFNKLRPVCAANAGALRELHAQLWEWSQPSGRSPFQACALRAGCL